MAWTTPKTDWVGTDTFNASDWLRIVGNLKYITDNLGIAYTPYTSVTNGDTVLTSADRNVVTDMIEEVYAKLHASWNRSVVAPRIDYGSTWGSKELNIIEKTISDFKDQIDGLLDGNATVYSGLEIICGDNVSIGLL